MKSTLVTFTVTIAALLVAACGGDAPPAKATSPGAAPAQVKKDEAPVPNEYSTIPAPAEEPKKEAAKPMPPAAPTAAPAEGVKK